MKRLFFLIVISLSTSVIVSAQKVNDKVQIEHSGTWYDGTVLKVNEAEQQFFVSYDGWSDSWNEWVGSDRLKQKSEKNTSSQLTRFRVGDRVEVDYGLIPSPARVITVGEDKYEIEFENKSFGKKWVTEKLIKKL